MAAVGNRTLGSGTNLDPGKRMPPSQLPKEDGKNFLPSILKTFSPGQPEKRETLETSSGRELVVRPWLTHQRLVEANMRMGDTRTD
nr:hypothetical protein L203_05467 [Cryptococcus depauperatus CBS 7841]